jgi:SAM-dependent methyltransferase
VLGNARLYDFVQTLAGRFVTARRLRMLLGATRGQIVLDLGAGTGSLATLLPAGATYWGLDNDALKVERLAAKVPEARVLQRSALDTGLDDDAADVTVCVDVTHHLEERELPRLVAEMARVTRERLVFVDALRARRFAIGRLLWRIDRGSHPRTAEALLAALGERFELTKVERYRFWHHYMLCVARPRTPAGRP